MIKLFDPHDGQPCSFHLCDNPAIGQCDYCDELFCQDHGDQQTSTCIDCENMDE